ncbi:MAG: ATP-dependent sacrificial sulfur transferase LarE [Candidatus Saliniplasma sp.]
MKSKIESRWNELLDWYNDEDITKAAVAFSGGKDSTLVLDSAVESLDDVTAFIIDAEVYPDSEVRRAEELVKQFDVPYQVIKTSKLNNEDFSKNPADRCYHCKKMLFETIKKRLEGDRVILEGTNASEIKGHRPGLKAVEKYARAPLLEVGLEEAEIRRLLRWRGREVWNRPSYACLASRFPEGSRLTEEKLGKLEMIEDKIHSMGISQLRVRDFKDTARIEVWPKEMRMILDKREKIVEMLKEHGYDDIFLDLQGYRTGSISPDE